MNKSISTYYDEERAGEVEFFFNDDVLITVIDGNDGNYRPEYMNCLFEHFGIKVSRIQSLTPLQDKAIADYCESVGL